MNLRKLLTLLLVLVAITALTVACQPQDDGGGEPPADTETSDEEGATEEEEEEEESTLERARREGVIRVGFANENPYAFAQPDGTLSGEAVEVARAVFQELGIEEMEGVLTQFGSLIPGLQAGRFDVITAGMYITPSRCEEVLFADPEYQVGEALIVEAGNPLDLHSYEDIAANSDVTVGTGAGYLEIDYMLAAGVSEDQIVEFPDDPSGVAGLQAGQIDAWTGTRPTLLITLQTTDDPNLELADPFEQPTVDGEPVTSYGGAAFRYEDLEFREAFNEELQNLKDSGELLELVGQFEGFDEAAMPGDVTAEDICPDAYSDLE
ncbi:MAG: ectoine/hydroxyectoine ABC transporter substrate-binding protein EhuB [bacterium]